MGININEINLVTFRFTERLIRELPPYIALDKRWHISHFGEHCKIYVHIYPKEEEIVEIIEYEEDFPSQELIATIILLLA